jgi:hypothetical protein
MTPKQFWTMIDGLGDPVTEEEAYDACRLMKELPRTDRDWPKLAQALDFEGKTYEQLRGWYKYYAREKGDIEKDPSHMTPDELAEVRADGEEAERRLDEKAAQVRKERMKLETLQLHRSREERQGARREELYEMVRDAIERLPLPDGFDEAPEGADDGSGDGVEYVVEMGDEHYGTEFESVNNSYSAEECARRFAVLTGRVRAFIKEKGLRRISVVDLGDEIQGMLRISDLAAAQIPVTEAVVGIARLMAGFLNAISADGCRVEAYIVGMSNHGQIRPIGTKANELATDDVGYIIVNYIADLLGGNPNVRIHGDGTQECLQLEVAGNRLFAMHGHQIDNFKTAVKDVETLYGTQIDYLLLGHTHNPKEIAQGERGGKNIEVLVAPAFVGTDHYSDSLLVGSKAGVKILGFDRDHGHVESYSIILN